MEQVLDAIYKDGVLQPLEKLDLPENQRVQIIISLPDQVDVNKELQAWHAVYDGLTAEEVVEIETTAFDRTSFMDQRQ